MECLSYVDLSHDYSKSIILTRLSPVSAVCEASSSTSRSHFLVPPPPTPLRIQQWQSDHVPILLSLPIPLFLDDVELGQLLPLIVPVQLLHLPPLCPTSQSPFCRQYLSETRNFKVQIFLNLKLDQGHLLIHQ